MLSNPSPIYLSLLEADPHFDRREAANRAGLVATCAFPILVGHEPVGVLEFFSSQAMEPPGDLLRIMDQVGTQLGRVVERHRAELRQTRHAHQLEQLSTQLETVLNSAGEGIYGLDTSRRVTFVNHAGAALLGRSRDDMVGRLEAEVIPTEPDSDGEEADATGRRNISRHRRADGTHFESESIAAPIVQDGQEAGTVVVFRDISERRALERLKNQFISVVSHELRTPLTSIRGALGLLDGGVAGPLPPRATRMVHVAMTSTDRLIRLITDILDVERIAAGQLALHRDTAQVRGLIATAVEETAVLATERDVRVEIGDTPGVVLADGDRVIQILTNLIGNAIKFSPARSTVELSTSVTGHEVRFDVADHGRGVEARDLDVIFEPFRQADSSDTRDHGGSGLGLAICRGLVEQHGGRICAGPTPGGGATFSFTLPMG
jgi:PAS domain S-box-containing protein